MDNVINFMPFLMEKKISQLSPADFNLYFDSEEEIWKAETKDGEVVYSDPSYEGISHAVGWYISSDLIDEFEKEFGDEFEDEYVNYEEM